MTVPEKARTAIGKDLAVLASFIGIFCAKKHPQAEKAAVRWAGVLTDYPVPTEPLCRECGQLLLYSATKRITCPRDPKPACRKCPAHCYRNDYRERMQAVMRFSGRLYARSRWRQFWRRWWKAYPADPLS